MSTDTRIGLILGGALFVIFWASPVLRVHDSQYSMLLSEQLLLNQSFELDDYFRREDRGDSARTRWRRLPRHVRPSGDHLYYWYPPGTPLLSVPLAAALRNMAHAFAPGDQVAPCAVLWTDPERLWEAVVPQLQAITPELFALGDYANTKWLDAHVLLNLS